MSDIVFLRDATMPREQFDTLPDLSADLAALVDRCKRMAGRLCRAKIERDGVRAWHAIACIYINGAERVTAARVRLGRYQSED